MAERFFLVRVPNWTNVQVATANGQWQAPVRADRSAPQPRELLNAAWTPDGGRVVLIVALESQRG